MRGEESSQNRQGIKTCEEKKVFLILERCVLYHRTVLKLGQSKGCWKDVKLVWTCPPSFPVPSWRADPCVPQCKAGVTPELGVLPAPLLCARQVLLYFPHKIILEGLDLLQDQKKLQRSGSSSVTRPSWGVINGCSGTRVWASRWGQSTKGFQTTSPCLLETPSLIFKDYMACCGLTMHCILIIRTKLYWF